MLLEPFDDVLEHGEEHESADFARRGLRGRAALMKEGEEFGPLTVGDFDGGDGRDDACRRVADELAVVVVVVGCECCVCLQ